MHEFIYQLHVKLLGADKSTVISEHTANPTEDLSVYSHRWKEVSYRAPDWYKDLPVLDGEDSSFSLYVSLLACRCHMCSLAMDLG